MPRFAIGSLLVVMMSGSCGTPAPAQVGRSTSIRVIAAIPAGGHFERAGRRLVDAHVGMPLYSGDRVYAPANGHVDIGSLGKLLVRIDKGSVVTVWGPASPQGARLEAGRLKLRLVRGSVLVRATGIGQTGAITVDAAGRTTSAGGATWGVQLRGSEVSVNVAEGRAIVALTAQPEAGTEVGAASTLVSSGPDNLPSVPQPLGADDQALLDRFQGLALSPATPTTPRAGDSVPAPAFRAVNRIRLDPFQGGWTEAPPNGGAFEGGRETATTVGESYVWVARGSWESQLLGVQPLRYYRVTCRVRAQRKGYWAAILYDDMGNEVLPDDYDSVLPSDRWEQQDIVFRAGALESRARLRFQAIDGPVAVGSVSIEDSDAVGAAAWADRIYAQCPQLSYSPPMTGIELLPRTMARLRTGGRLRIVVLGDSVANDVCNSLFEALLERRFPGTQIEVVSSVRSSTGAGWYRQEGRVQEFVLRFQPDLLIIAGISNGPDPAPVQSVIEQVRAKSDPEILVLTDVITPLTILESPVDFARLRRMAAEERVAALDLRRPWEVYVRSQQHPAEWFLRDSIHANARGKQIAGRMLARYLEDGAASRVR